MTLLTGRQDFAATSQVVVLVNHAILVNRKFGRASER